MALKEYNKSEAVWKDIADLQIPGTDGVRCEAPSANAYENGVWTEVWSALPDGYLIYKSKVYSEELTQWSLSKHSEGAIIDYSYPNMIGQSELTTSWNHHRFREKIISDYIAVPSGATKLYIEYEFAHTSSYTMDGCYIEAKLVPKTSVSGNHYISPNWTLGTRIASKDISAYAGNSVAIESTFYVYKADASVPQFNVNFKIKNMWFE